MEYLDVLDEKGNPTGKKKLRTEIHRDGDWHRAAHVWIVNSKEELLIQKRSSRTDTSPNLWDISSAGHIPAGVHAIDSAMREIQEELGLSLSAKNFESLGRVTQEKRESTYWNREFDDVYLITHDLDLAILRLQEEEVTAVRWIPFRELEKLINAGDKNFVPHDNEYKKLFNILHKRYDKVSPS